MSAVAAAERPFWSIGWIMTLILLVVFATLSAQLGAAAAVSRPDLPAPAFTLPAFSSSDKPLSFGELRGRPVVINFWASWDAAARAETTMLEHLSQSYQYRDHGLVVVGVAAYDAFRPAKEFVKELVLTYPTGHDATGEISRAYQVSSVPETYFISRDGRIVRKHRGPLREAELREHIEELLR